MSCVNVNQFLCAFPFGFEGGLWDLIVLVPDCCFSFYFTIGFSVNTPRIKYMLLNVALYIYCMLFSIFSEFS